MKTKVTHSAMLTDGETEVPPVLSEISMLPEVGEAINVRAAKAQLSGLLDVVAEGREVVITSGGKPKAKVVAYRAVEQRQAFGGAEAHLSQMPAWKGGPTADETVRADREERW